MLIPSTSTPSSSIPMGVIITSDEQQVTIKSGLKMLADILPEKRLMARVQIKVLQ